MTRRPPRKVTCFEPVAPRLGRNTVIESTFEVGRRFRGCQISSAAFEHIADPEFVNTHGLRTPFSG